MHTRSPLASARRMRRAKVADSRFAKSARGSLAARAFVDPASQLVAMQAERTSSRGDVPGVLGEHAFDLRVVEIARGRRRIASRRRLARCRPELHASVLREMIGPHRVGTLVL